MNLSGMEFERNSLERADGTEGFPDVSELEKGFQTVGERVGKPLSGSFHQNSIFAGLRLVKPGNVDALPGGYFSNSFAVQARAPRSLVASRCCWIKASGTGVALLVHSLRM